MAFIFTRCRCTTPSFRSMTMSLRTGGDKSLFEGTPLKSKKLQETFSLAKRRYNIYRRNVEEANGNRNGANGWQFQKTHNGAIPYIAVGGVLLGFVFGYLRRSTSHCSVKTTEDLDQSQNTSSQEHSNQEDEKTLMISEAAHIARDLAQRVKDETGSPGLVMAVSINGEEVWSEGLGYADLENRVSCSPQTIMRIASISKSIAMTGVARLIEQGKLDLDKPVQHYVPKWPEKTYQGEKVTITTRQLVSHLGGLRHYDKNCGRSKKNTEKEKKGKDQGDKGSSQKASAENKNTSKPSEFENKEYYIKDNYRSVKDALELFKNDELCSLPGTSFLYTTHGWTLISAVVEGASGKKYTELMRTQFKELGLHHTYLDENEPVIYNRAKFYEKNKKGHVVNAKYVNNSYKWAGGGFLSDTHDLIKFGNAMLYSYQWTPERAGTNPPGYLKPDTMAKLWTPVPKTKCGWDASGFYGMGWGIIPQAYKRGQCEKTRFYVSHTGAAVGSSSVLLILPRYEGQKVNDLCPPEGVVVAMMANMTSVSLNKTALEIAKLFEKVKLK